MAAWFAANIGTIIISAVLIAAVAAIIRRIIKDRKAGISSCGGNCASCGMCSSCRQKR